MKCRHALIEEAACLLEIIHAASEPQLDMSKMMMKEDMMNAVTPDFARLYSNENFAKLIESSERNTDYEFKF